MSDIPALALALVAGALLGAFFFGGLWWTVQKGVDVREAGALVPRQPAAANRCDSGWILFCFAGSLVEARDVPPWVSDRARHRREAAHTSAGGRADSIGRGDQQCALAPDELVFWRYGFVELNSTIVTTWALMLVMTVGAMADHAQARDRSAYLALARLPGNRGHHDSGTDQRSGPAPSGEVSRLYWHLVSVHRGVQPLCDPPRVRTHRPVRSRPRRRWRSRCLSPCRSSASRSKGWAVTSSPT